MAGLRMLGRRAWPAVLAGAIAAGLLAHLPLPAVIAGAVGLTLEALVGAWMLDSAGFDDRLARAHDVIVLIGTALVAPAASAIVGTVGARVFGALDAGSAPEVLLAWWRADAEGLLLVTPAVLVLRHYQPAPDTRRRALELTALIGLYVASVATTMFAQPRPGMLRYPLAFLAFPCTTWAALRFGPRSVAISNVLVSTAVVSATLLDAGPFVVAEPAANLILAQAFLASLALTGLLLSAVITERTESWRALRLRERDLRESASDLLAITHAFQDRYYWLDPEGRFLPRRSVSRAAVDPAAAPGRRLADVLPAAAAGPVLEAAARCRASGEPQSLEFADDRLDRERYCEARLAPLVDDTVLLIVRDVTEARRIQGRLQQSQKMEAIGRMAGGVAHDFNNVLTAIQAYGELLHEAPAQAAERAEWGDELLKAVERATSLTRRLLSLSRQQSPATHAQDLGAVAHDVATMLERLTGENVTLRIDAPTGEAWVLAEPGQLEQVLVNLVMNARDAMPNGGLVRVLVDTLDVDPQHWSAPRGLRAGRWARLRVADDGEGMTQETLSRAFEPFFTTKSPDRGSGLGLAIVYGILQQAGGEVAVTSAPGRGTTFTLYWPVVARPEGTVEPSAPDAAAPAATGATVLLAEDDDMVRTVVANGLRRSGYHVIAATNGEEALALAESTSGAIHLLLSDVRMPGMTGHELARRLVQLRPGTRTLFMSAYEDAGIAARDGGLAKPFTIAAMLERVRETLAEGAPAT